MADPLDYRTDLGGVKRSIDFAKGQNDNGSWRTLDSKLNQGKQNVNAKAVNRYKRSLNFDKDDDDDSMVNPSILSNIKNKEFEAAVVVKTPRRTDR